MVKITGLLAVILVLALIVTPVRSAPPAQDSSIQGILAGSLVAKQIPPAPANGQEIDTPLGTILVNFDDDAKQAEITLFNGSVRHIPYPPGFSTFLANASDGVVSNVIDNDFTGLTLGQHVLAVCGVADDSTSYGLVIDLTLNKFVVVTKVSDCFPYVSVSWSRSYRYLAFCVHYELKYDNCIPQSGGFYYANASKTISLADLAQQTGSWLPMWSPHWRYTIDKDEITDYSMWDSSCKNLFNFPAVVPEYSWVIYSIDEAAQMRKSLFCTGWTRIDVEHWMDAHRAILRGSDPEDNVTDYQYFFADFSMRKVIDLGQVVRTGVSFSPDFSKLFMIKHTTGSDGVNPIICTLTMVNLSTLASTDIEQDDCNQASDITIIDKVNKVAYLDSVFDGGTLTPYFHLVDMNTLAVTKFPMTAINGINSLAPNQRYIGLIADTVHSDGRDATTLVGYQHPVLNIFDVQQQKLVYSHDCLTLADFAQCIFGSPTGTAAYFMAGTYDNPTIYLVKLGSTVDVSAISEATASDSNSYSQWSPDGGWLMIYTKAGIQLVSASDVNKRIPITTTVPAGMTASWYAKNNIELHLSDGTRWLVTVPSL